MKKENNTVTNETAHLENAYATRNKLNGCADELNQRLVDIKENMNPDFKKIDVTAKQYFGLEDALAQAVIAALDVADPDRRDNKERLFSVCAVKELISKLVNITEEDK